MPINRRIRIRTTCYGNRSGITASGILVIDAIARIVISCLVPFIVARQNVFRQTIAIRIGCIVASVTTLPQRDIVVDTIGGELVSGSATRARIEPIDEPGRFVP